MILRLIVAAGFVGAFVALMGATWVCVDILDHGAGSSFETGCLFACALVALFAAFGSACCAVFTMTEIIFDDL